MASAEFLPWPQGLPACVADLMPSACTQHQATQPCVGITDTDKQLCMCQTKRGLARLQQQQHGCEAPHANADAVNCIGMADSKCKAAVHLHHHYDENTINTLYPGDKSHLAALSWSCRSSILTAALPSVQAHASSSCWLCFKRSCRSATAALHWMWLCCLAAAALLSAVTSCIKSNRASGKTD